MKHRASGFEKKALFLLSSSRATLKLQYNVLADHSEMFEGSQHTDCFLSLSLSLYLWTKLIESHSGIELTQNNLFAHVFESS